jgi:hypothetical protein
VHSHNRRLIRLSTIRHLRLDVQKDTFAFTRDDRLCNVPLYAVSSLPRLLQGTLGSKNDVEGGIV